MIKCKYYFGILVLSFVAGSVMLHSSESAAEPIPGDMGFDVPKDKTPQNQESTDALALFKTRDYQGSLKLWREAVKKNPNLPPAQVIMAQLYLQGNMIPESRNAVEQAIAEVPTDPEAYILSARFCLNAGNLDKAESNLQKADSLLAGFKEDDSRKTRLQMFLLDNQALLAQARKDWPGAQKLFEALLKLDPKNANVLHKIAFCLFQEKLIDQSLETLQEIPKLDPKALAPQAMLSQFYDQAGDHQNAEKQLAAAVATSPKNLQTRLMAGNQAMLKGQLEEARKHSVAAMQIDQKSPDAQILQATIAAYEKNYLTAELLFETVLKSSPNNPVILNNLAMMLIQQDEDEKKRRALEYAETLAKKFPKSPQVASTYGYVLYRLGRLDDAERELQAAMPIASTDLDTAYVLARVAVDRGRKDEARQLLETGLKKPQSSLFRQESEELLKELKK
jgi:tetratricopeptide (TPR) repeat protein